MPLHCAPALQFRHIILMHPPNFQVKHLLRAVFAMNRRDHRRAGARPQAFAGLEFPHRHEVQASSLYSGWLPVTSMG